jgi:predicted nucleotidyltransferase
MRRPRSGVPAVASRLPVGGVDAWGTAMLYLPRRNYKRAHAYQTSMRPLSTQQSFLRYPLSLVLASEGNVRVLREILRHGGELNPPTIAKRTGVSPQHVRQILGGMVATGIVAEVGQGRYLSYRGNAEHPLYPALSELFRQEESRFDEVLSAVRRAVEADASDVLSVWLYGSVARGEDAVGSDVDVAVVVSDGEVEEVVGRVRDRLREAESRLDVRFSVVGLDAADVLRLADGDAWWNSMQEDALTLVGADPSRLATQLRRSTNRMTAETSR